MDIESKSASTWIGNSFVHQRGATNLAARGGLKLMVYPSRERAEKAQSEAGGIILEVTAACLGDAENELQQQGMPSLEIFGGEDETWFTTLQEEAGFTSA